MWLLVAGLVGLVHDRSRGSSAPPRVCRRLQLLRDWSHDESEDIPEVLRRGA